MGNEVRDVTEGGKASHGGLCSPRRGFGLYSPSSRKPQKDFWQRSEMI